jgi:hypothetical protein
MVHMLLTPRTTPHTTPTNRKDDEVHHKPKQETSGLQGYRMSRLPPLVQEQYV